jgi:hypothetical protein
MARGIKEELGNLALDTIVFKQRPDSIANVIEME